MSSSGADMLISRHPKWYEIRGQSKLLPALSRPRGAAGVILSQIRVARAPVDVAAILRRLGVIVQERNTSDLARTWVEPAQGVLGDTFRAVIEVRRWQPSPSKRYVLAHALGHILMHDFTNEGRGYVEAPFSRMTGIVESEADRFACELLMPDYLVERYMAVATTLPNNAVRGMAAEFDVDEGRMDRRLKELYG